MGLFRYDREITGDYSLKLDWKLHGDDNSGVFLGFPRLRRPVVRRRQRLRDPDRCHRHRRPHHRLRLRLPVRRPRRPGRGPQPAGEWNTYELRVTGERLEIFLNGRKINDFTNTDPARSLRQGYIGLQNHGDGDEVSLPRHPPPAGRRHPGPRTGEIRGVNGKCLDVDNAGTADGTGVQIYTCNSSAAQRWTVADDGTLRALGKCLDVSGGGSADGTRIQLWTCNGTGAQKWAAQSDGTVRNPQSGKCMDASGGTWEDRTPVHLWTCHTGPNQKWTLPEVILAGQLGDPQARS